MTPETAPSCALKPILSAAKNDKLEVLNPPRLERRLRGKVLARSRRLTCAQKEGSEQSSLVLYHAAFSSMARQVDNALCLVLHDGTDPELATQP